MQHFNEVASEISDRINELHMTYDSRILAAIMLRKAAGLLQNLYSSGIYSKEEVEGIIRLATEDCTTRSDVTPAIVTHDPRDSRAS